MSERSAAKVDRTVPTEGIAKLAQDNLVVVLIGVLVVVTIIVEPQFMTIGNMTNIMRQFGPLIMVAMGMTFVIIAGFIDLSVPGVMSLVAVVTLSLIEPIGQGPALIVGLGVGTLAGVINSALIIKCGALTFAEALFITYGLSVVYGGLALLYTGGVTNYLIYLDADFGLFTTIGTGTIGFFSLSFIMFLVILTVLYVFQSKTLMGRYISLVGGNKTAARLSGIPINRSIVSVFAISGFMAALGAIILFSRVGLASPVLGSGWDLQAILAVVLGGTPIANATAGGKGSVLRTVLGTLLIILLGNCLNLLGVSVYLQFFMRGAILVLAIWLDSKKQK